MTDKERIERLEDRVRDLERVAYRLKEKPQHPKPGTVVEWYDELFPERKYMGLVSDCGTGVRDETGDLFQWDEIEYRPVEILREGEYKITPPPLEDWPGDAVAWILTEHESFFWNFDYVFSIEHRYGLGRHIATVTKEDMERKEAGE